MFYQLDTTSTLYLKFLHTFYRKTLYKNLSLKRFLVV